MASTAGGGAQFLRRKPVGNPGRCGDARQRPEPVCTSRTSWSALDECASCVFPRVRVSPITNVAPWAERARYSPGRYGRGMLPSAYGCSGCPDDVTACVSTHAIAVDAIAVDAIAVDAIAVDAIAVNAIAIGSGCRAGAPIGTLLL